MGHGVHGKILAAVALCRHSAHTLEAARRLARTDGGTVTVLHVVTLPSFVGISSGDARADLDTLERYVHHAGRERLGTLVERAGLGPGSIARLAVGDPAQVIVDEARRMGADAIVLGAEHHHGFGRLVLGSVAARVRDRSPCPVVVSGSGEGATPMSARS